MRHFKLFFACMLLTVFSIGQVWGATQVGSITFNFEDDGAHRANTNNSYSTNSYSQHDVTISCSYMDIVTTGTPLSGSANALGRVAKKTKNSPVLTIGPIDLSDKTITGISYNVKGVAAMAQICGYSTDGSTWTNVIGINGGSMPTAKTLEESGALTVTGTSDFYVKITTSVSTQDDSKNRDVQIDDIVISYTYEESDVIVKTLKSIAVSGQTTTYDQFAAFSFDGTCTATYSVTKNNVAQADEEKTVTPTSVSSPDMTITGSKEVTVSFTDGDVTKTAKYNITVNAHEVTPGKYDITLANAFWGTSGTGASAGHTASGTKNDITISIAGTSGTQNYINDSETRVYGSHTITFSVPSGYVLKEITGLGSSSKSDISVATGSTGSINTRVWTGSTNSVTFTVNGRTDFTTVSVTYTVYVPVTDCATPTFSPAAGSYEGTQSVTITCETDGATIYYTTDGSTPTTISNVYSDAMSVSATQTIKAYAVKEGLNDSEVAEATYTIVAGADVVLDFTSNTEWQFPSTKTADEGSYTAGGYTIKVAGSSGNGYNYDTDHLFIGKSGAYITLPTLDFPVSKVVCVGVESGSGSVSFNLYDGDDAVSTSVTSCKVDQTFDIDEGLQESNKTYTIRITNAYNARFAKIKIYRGVEAAVKKPTISGPTHFLTSTTVTLDCETDGATIYYTTDGTDPKTSDTKLTYSNPFELTAYTTITVRAKKNDDWSAAVSKNFVKETLMTVAEAKTAIDAGGDLTNKFVKGIISQIDSYDNTTHAITYWISDDGTTTNQLEVFKGLSGVVKAQFEAATDIKVGEEVIVTGTLKKFGASTYEFDKENTIVAYRPFAPIVWSADPFVAVFGGSNTFPTLNNATGLTITYASSDPSKASFADASVYDITLNAVTGENPITITATSAATENYVQTSVSYSMTVAASVTYYSLSYEKNGGVSDATDLDQATNIPANLPTITKAGFNFGGWFTTSDFQQATKVSGGEELTENTTLYAQWLNPYTVEDALTMIAALEDNGSTEALYVAGVVTDDALTLESGNTATYLVKDAGETNSLTIYKGKGKKTNEAPDGENITATDYLQEDDALVIYGQLKKYVNKSGTTPEIVSSYIFSLDRPIVAVQGVSLPATASVRAGKTITLTPIFNPTNATNKNVTWNVTAGSSYADVDANGVVTGKAQGTATVQVETEDGGFTATCEVTVAAATPTFNDPTYHWKKITAASQLKAGRYYVIAESSKNKTATYELSSGALGVATSTIEEDAIAYNALGSKTAVFELGGTSGAWTLTEITTKDQMLGGAGTTSLTWGTGTTTWPISIDDKGNAVIGDANDNRILYNQNGSNPRVKTYSSALSTSMLLPQLYVWESTATPITPIGGKFTINAKGDTAVFARGNLQYQQSTNTWRCAPNQTDWCGVDANLEMGNSSYDGWVDLFCWSIGAENNYGATSNYNTAMYVDKSFVDWGTLFATAEEWSTLTSAEWTYLLNTRAGANDKWGMAMIDGNLGMIILPDEWKAPSGVTFVPRTNPTSELWDENDYLVPGERDHCRVKPENMPANKFTQSQWAILENAGAVFLPYAGRRSGGYDNYLNTKCETVTEMFRYVYYENYLGTYWTSTLHNASKGQADYIYTFKYSKVGGEEYYDWGKNVIWSENGRYGQSVRLVTRIPKRYTVTYVTTGSTGTTPVDPRGEVGYIEGETIEHLESGDGLTNAGYIFEGWNDGTNTYPAGAEYTIGASDVTLTAVWARESEQKWTLVETLAGIKTDGTEYVIAADGDYNVAMAALNGAIYNTTPVRKDDKILVGSDQMTVVTFENGSESGKYAIKNGSKYIASETAKSMKEQDDSFDWTITIEDGVASISTTVGYLKYNNQSPRFTTYASGQKPVAIYQKVPTVIIENETVNLEDLSAGTNIIVKDNGVLNVNEDKQVGDLTVLNGGKVTIADNVLTVTGTFLIETMMASGKSGQVVGATTDKFVGSGDGFQAYIDITLGAGATNEQWHAFTVPFPVDVLNGIYDLADNKLQNEVNYAIMDYHGDIRATGKYGWKKIRTTLVPGTFYIMATDGYRTTYRFKKKAGAALVAENSMSYSQYAESEAGVYGIDNGWNGIGNPNLFYGKVNLPVQVLNPTTYTYEPYVGKDANSTNFIVGTPFFYQASADGSVVMTTADAGANYAPARYTMPKEIKDVEVRFGNDEYSDRLYISANEDALSTYETGKDLIKMTMTSTPKVAQIFGCAYDTKLCMVNAPLRNDQAIYSLKLYAPTDGEYTITIPEVDNADIYLTYDNHIVWNVAASEYTCELKAGETNNYGLILRMKAPEVTTSVEQSGVINGINTVQKIILNDHVYILRGEKLYDVTGKMVK